MTHQPRTFWLLNLAVAGLVLWVLWPAERITPRAALALKLGMSYAEAEQLFGDPVDRKRYLLSIQIANSVPLPYALWGNEPGTTHTEPDWPAAAPPRMHVRLSSTSPWDPQYALFGDWLPQPIPPASETIVWVGSQVAVVGLFRDQKLHYYAVVPVLREGGGVLGWLRHKYDDWKTPKATAPAPGPFPKKPRKQEDDTDQ